MMAALFLIYASRRGLLERELRILLCTYEKSQGWFGNIFVAVVNLIYVVDWLYFCTASIEKTLRN